MQRTYDIYPDERLILVRFHGAISYEDILMWLEEALDDQHFSKWYNGVVDLRNAVFAQHRLEKAHLLARFVAEQDLTSGRWAILADKPMETALSILYGSATREKHPIRVVSTIRGASAFLGNDVETLELLLREE